MVQGRKRPGKPVRLTHKQQRFVEEYIKDYKLTEAAIRAGYSPRTAAIIGCKLLRKPHVKAELQKHKDEFLARSWLTVEKVLADLEEIRERAMADKDYKAATRAAELLGKYLSMWAERVEHKVEHSGGIQMTLCSVDHARRILRESLAHDDVIDQDDDD